MVGDVVGAVRRAIRVTALEVRAPAPPLAQDGGGRDHLFGDEPTLEFVALLGSTPPPSPSPPQLKVLTTAAFSVALLGRSLHVRKPARALLTLTLGVVLISAETKPKVRSARANMRRALTAPERAIPSATSS